MAKTNEIAIVTGAGSGLGLEIALLLVAANKVVVGVCRRPPEDSRWTDVSRDGKAHLCLGDVADPKTVDAAFSHGQRLGRVSIVINCAGQGVFGPVGSYSRESVDAVLAGNLIGTILFSEKAFGLLKTEGGTILNVMSTAAHVARANEAIYCAAKWAARAYTETMRVEAKGLPIRIISAYPGGMATRFWREASGHKVDANKFMDPQDVARTIVDSLHDRASSYVSDLIINRK